MNCREDKKYKEIGQIINSYLRKNHLPKIAYLTNCLPNRYDKDYLFEDFNYICFCASSVTQMSQFLFKRYLLKYGKMPFDVVISSPKSCLLSRQYGYVFLHIENIRSGQELVDFVSQNKNQISCTYPILLRINWVSGMDGIRYPQNCIVEKKWEEADIVLQID